METSGPAARHYRDRVDPDSQTSPGVVRQGVERVLDALDPAALVVDVGSGVGGNLALAGPNRRIVGTDVSLDALRRARSFAPVVLADAAALPFRPGVFDVAICTEVLEHVDAPGAVFAEMARTLRRGGFAYVTTPNYANLAGLHKLIADRASGRHDWNPWGAHEGGHEAFMTARRLLSALRPHLRVESVRALDYGQALTGRFRVLDKLAWTGPGQRVLRGLLPRIENPRLPVLPRHGMHVEVVARRGARSD